MVYLMWIIITGLQPTQHGTVRPQESCHGCFVMRRGPYMSAS